MKVLIIGAASGIGFDTGVMLAKKGYEVVLAVHKEGEISTTLDKVKVLALPISCIKLDVTVEKELDSLSIEGYDVIIHNAAIGVGGPIAEIDQKQVRENFEVNVFANLSLFQKEVREWHGKDQKRKIVVISSLAGIIPIPFLGSYSSTKAALKMMTTCLHLELLLQKSSVQVKLIEPGFYNTGFNQFMLEEKKEALTKLELSSVKKWSSFEDCCIFFLECTKTDSIVRKIVKAVESDSIRLKYRAPVIQAFFARCYQLFFY